MMYMNMLTGELEVSLGFFSFCFEYLDRARLAVSPCVQSVYAELSYKNIRYFSINTENI